MCVGEQHPEAPDNAFGFVAIASKFAEHRYTACMEGEMLRLTTLVRLFLAFVMS